MRALITRINKKHGAGTIVLGSQITQPMLSRISSGSLGLDVAIGGGWVTNHWTEVIGHESVGKTLLVLKTIAYHQKRDPDWTVVWFATEDFVESYAEMLGCDIERIIVVNENRMESVYEWAKEFVELKAVDCIVIDSLPALIPAREMDATMEDWQPGLAAFITGKFFRKTGKIQRSLVEEERPCIGFVINQYREKIGTMFGDPRTTPGGKAKNFAYFMRVEVQRAEWINNTRNDPIGQVLKVINVKNKTAPPRRSALIDVYFADGNGFKAGSFDIIKDITNAALAYDVIQREGKGSMYTFGEERWRGKEAINKALRAEPKLRQQIRKAVMAEATNTTSTRGKS